MRITDVMWAIPTLVLAMAIVVAFGRGLDKVMIALALVHWRWYVRVLRAEILTLRDQDYVQAAKIMGVSDVKIILRHILPNAMVSTITFMPFILSGSVTTLTALDFLGFGLPVGSPSLGELLRQGKANLHATWIGISAFVVLSVMLTLLVFIGEAARDALDPRHTANNQ